MKNAMQGGSVGQTSLMQPFSDKQVRLWAWSPERHIQLERAFLTGENPALKAEAVSRFNAMMRNLGDAIKLSSNGSFPDLQEQGIPAAFLIDASTRETIDTRWTLLYRILDRRSSQSPVFRVGDAYTNLTFNEYALNEDIDADYIEGAHRLYEMSVYAGMYYYNKMWAQWTDMWDEQEGLAMMGVRWARAMAKAAYEAVAASGATSVSYDTGGATALEKDINTINAGITTIQSQLYNATTGDGNTILEDVSQGRFALLYNNLTAGYQARITKALEARLEAPNDNQSIGYVMSPVVPIGSPHIATGTWKLTLLGRRNVFAMGRDLMVDTEMDPKKAGVGMVEVGQGAFKAVRDDVKQVVSLALS